MDGVFDAASEKRCDVGPMRDMRSRVVSAWLAEYAGGKPWGQVRVMAVNAGHELRHVLDTTTPESQLQELTVEALCAWADEAAPGVFRPLKAAPTLRRGWRCGVADEAALERALDLLYPGSLADWWAERTGEERVTPFLEYAARQTGMYRSVRGLDASGAARVSRACCDVKFCLKRPLWSPEAGGIAAGQGKSDIPCWEPCAVALELARRESKMVSGPQSTLTLPADELPVLRSALERIVAMGLPGDVREGDLASSDNPRRLQLLLERLRPELSRFITAPEK